MAWKRYTSCAAAPGVGGLHSKGGLVRGDLGGLLGEFGHHPEAVRDPAVTRTAEDAHDVPVIIDPVREGLRVLRDVEGGERAALVRLAAALKRKPTVALQTCWPFRDFQAGSPSGKGRGSQATARCDHVPEQRVPRRTRMTGNRLKIRCSSP
jgi:hypothetical protein